jgi:hypothetical protein
MQPGFNFRQVSELRIGIESASVQLHVQQKLCVKCALHKSFAACSCSKCWLVISGKFKFKNHFNPTARKKAKQQRNLNFMRKQVKNVLES